LAVDLRRRELALTAWRSSASQVVYHLVSPLVISCLYAELHNAIKHDTVFNHIIMGVSSKRVIFVGEWRVLCLLGVLMDIYFLFLFLPFVQQLCAAGLSFNRDEESPRRLYYTTLLIAYIILLVVLIQNWNCKKKYETEGVLYTPSLNLPCQNF
jgi:hypothetical protein